MECTLTLGTHLRSLLIEDGTHPGSHTLSQKTVISTAVVGIVPLEPNEIDRSMHLFTTRLLGTRFIRVILSLTLHRLLVHCIAHNCQSLCTLGCNISSLDVFPKVRILGLSFSEWH